MSYCRKSEGFKIVKQFAKFLSGVVIWTCLMLISAKILFSVIELDSTIKEILGLIFYIFLIYFFMFVVAKIMGYKDTSQSPDVSNLNEEERQALKKYVVKQMRRTLKNVSQSPRQKIKEIRQIDRDRDIREVCLMRAGYRCEIDSEHISFNTVSGKQYIESHHIIPLRYQNRFDFNLDIVENLIALCPNCHKAIHHGDYKIKQQILKQIHNVRPITTYEKLKSLYLE